MKNRVSIILAICLLFMGTSSSPAQTPATGGGKIGFLNIQAAILNTAEGKKAMDDLNKKYEPKKTELQSMQKDIQNLEDQIQRQQTAVSDTAQAQLNRQLDEKKKILTRTQEDAQSDFGDDRSDVINRISQKMAKVIQDFAEKNGYSLILDRVAPVFSSNGQIGDAQVPVYYASKDVDITGEIVKLYDAANPAAAADSTAPVKPAAAKSTPKSPSKN